MGDLRFDAGRGTKIRKLHFAVVVEEQKKYLNSFKTPNLNKKFTSKLMRAKYGRNFLLSSFVNYRVYFSSIILIKKLQKECQNIR